ncbi:ribokinase [Lederbergia citri]|uniref:Deoxyribokinase n=1 Tax=Lederbergia citri TaxID=2833580 RepID=A0A942YJJ3_9BACI|nr:ribokinase [Lederbergia citri]MBS4197615.1 ribokinase [Lederbergia citri]
MSILVIGSFMMDLVVRTPRAPENGETLIGTNFSIFPGGKGANQAVSAARLGGKVTMVGKLGIDQFGDQAMLALNKENVNTKYILRDRENFTGVGSVILEDNGDNRIIVVPGANLNFTINDLENTKHLIRDAKIIVLQLEMDIKMVERAIAYATNYDVPILFNPAPAQKLSDDLLSKITYLTPNETEAEILTGITINCIENAKAAGRILMEKGVENIIITLAEKGALIVNQSGTYHIPGFPVNPVDSVAAGDSFNGALAVGIVSGKPLKEAVKFANAVGALTVTKDGAIPSLPRLEEVDNFLQHV